MVNTQFYLPPASLAHAVRYFMMFRSQLSADHSPISFPLPPIPEHFLCFYTFSPASLSNSHMPPQLQQPSVVVGPNNKLFFVHLPRHCFLLRVVLQPGILARLLRRPLTELHSLSSYDSMYTMGPDMAAVNEQLCYTTTDQEAINVVSQYLLRKLSRASHALAIDAAVSLLIARAGNISVDELAAYSCLSNRQLERQCLAHTGYSPKYLARLTRFSRAWTLKELTPAQTWTSIAQQSGYFDQMHFIRDFKEFTGQAPGALSHHWHNMPLDLKNERFFER